MCLQKLCAYIMKTAASPPSDAAARLREGGSLLARLCSLVTALGLEEGSDETRPHIEEYVGWLQVSTDRTPLLPCLRSSSLSVDRGCHAITSALSRTI